MVNPEQAQSSLQEIRTRQHQVAAEGLRTPRWYVVALAGVVLALNAAMDVLGGQEFLLLAGYLALALGMEQLVRRRRRARIHRSWYTPGRMLRTLGAVLVMLVAMGGATTAAWMLLAWQPGLGVPDWLAVGVAQALVVLVLLPRIERMCGWR